VDDAKAFTEEIPDFSPLLNISDVCSTLLYQDGAVHNHTNPFCCSSNQCWM